MWEQHLSIIPHPVFIYLFFWRIPMKKFLAIALFAAGSMSAMAHTPGTPIDADYNDDATATILVGVYQPTAVSVVYNSVDNNPAAPTIRSWFNSDQQKSFTTGYAVTGAAARIFNVKTTITVTPDVADANYAVVGSNPFMTLSNVMINRDNVPAAANYAGVTSWSNTTGTVDPASGPMTQIVNGSEHLHMGWPETSIDAPFSDADYTNANNFSTRFIKIDFDATAGVHGTSGRADVTVKLDVLDQGAVI
jgi:hypothetical protein